MVCQAMPDSLPGQPSYDVALMRDDMALKGWLPTNLARRARVSEMTVSRFLRGERQTAPTAKKLATALGYTIRRYYIPSRAKGQAVA